MELGERRQPTHQRAAMRSLSAIPRPVVNGTGTLTPGPILPSPGRHR
jgi:hypothetical protein